MIEEPDWAYPFCGMGVGDSFFVPTLRPAERIYRIDTMAKEYGIRIRAFVRRESGYLGIRVWRIR